MEIILRGTGLFHFHIKPSFTSIILSIFLFAFASSIIWDGDNILSS